MSEILNSNHYFITLPNIFTNNFCSVSSAYYSPIIMPDIHKISDILRSIRNRNRTGTRIPQILYETYIPYNQLKEYLIMMVQNNLIIYIKEDKIFKITEYGMHALKLYGEIDKLLVYNPIKQSVE